MEREIITRKLLRGETVDFEGIRLEMDEGPISSGDLYVAERNTGPKLLTALRISEELGCVFPTTPDYPYNIWECVKVKEST